MRLSSAFPKQIRDRLLRSIPVLLIVLIGTSATAPLKAQQTYTLSGYIKNKTNGEGLIGANVYVDSLGEGTVTNKYGYYSLTLPEGTYDVRYSYVGYRSRTYEIELDKSKRINANLRPTRVSTETVEVEGERPDENIQSVDVGTQKLDIKTVEKIPALLGEADILKSLQLLPGVQSAGEGTSGFRVRGGDASQNLVLLDNATVYNTGHLFGFFSVFNSNAIQSVELMKGGIPAQYGGRVSSVVDIAMKDGNDRSYEADGGIGLISSDVTVEGPIDSGRSSFVLSARRTYVDVLSELFAEGTELEGNSYYFYDLNGKVNYQLSENDRIYLSGYIGRDVFEFAGTGSDFQIEIPWGNRLGTVRWNHLFNDKLFMDVTATYNSYDFEVGVSQTNLDAKLFSGIEDYGLKTDFTWFPSPDQTVDFGFDYTYHRFTPSSVSGGTSDSGSQFSTDQVGDKFAHEGAIYVQDEIDFSPKLRVNAGLRYSFFQQVGPYRYFEDGQLQKAYDKGEPVEFYGRFEPRIRARYKLSATSSVKASFMRTNQYVHRVSNSGSTLPNDVWVPSTRNVKPESAIQGSAGYFRNFNNNMYETSLELYYRKMDNIIEYDNGYTPEIGRQLERDFVYGEGESFGAEMYIKKRKGNLTGWVSYTLSKTTRFFDDLRTSVFPSPYDRRHDLSIVGSYRLNERWSVSSTFVYGTGQPTTIPKRRFITEGTVHNVYGKRNNYRLEDYHRLDISATLRAKNYKQKDFKSEWVFSIYNVYNHKNPFFIYFENEGNLLSGDFNTQAKKVALFPIIPSVRWNFEF